MNLHRGAAVFQLVLLGHRVERQLALLADGHETDIQFVGDNGAENKAARIDARHHVRAQIGGHVAMHELVDEHAEHPRVLQQRGDVAELHAG